MGFLSEIPGTLIEQYRTGGPVMHLILACSIASLTVERWHAVLHLDHSIRSQYVPDDQFPRHSFELYDLEADPTCDVDLAEGERERASKLRAALVDWLNGRSSRPI